MLNKSKEERIQLYDSYMSHVTREGKDKLKKWLVEESTYFTGPASSNFHSNYDGGLFDHSENVLQFAMMLKKFMITKYKMIDVPSDESIIICALHHDLCKTNFYKKEMKWTKLKNTWMQYMGYVVTDDLPLGHGEKSLFLTAKHIELTDDEALAIRWHMGSMDPGTHFFYPSGSCANESRKRLLVALISNADYSAGMVEKVIDYKATATPKK